ncbi:hypothetical protein WNB94_11960 [Aquabacterium sp. A3]|uniref:hypothetical protein n=1 Tax=Aquabacterium sp. A3 TaxID=3132829 RepID=UPI003119DE9D
MLTTRYQKVRTLSLPDILRMHALFEAHYASSPLDTFLDDLSRKDGAFIVRRRDTGEIVGFSTLGVYEFQLAGRKAKGLFSGDTIIEGAHRGSRTLQKAFAWRIFIEALKAPLTPQYWLLISKGYKTYLLMARNFPDYYPRRGEDNPAMTDMVAEYCEAMFPGKLNRDTMLLEFGDDANRLKPEVADITDAMRRDPDIRHFERLNPTWAQGTELPCIARADLWAFLKTIGPFMAKVVRDRLKGRPVPASTVSTVVPADQSDDVVRPA